MTQEQFENDFTTTFRFIISSKMKILINDMNPTIEVLKLFISEVLCKEDGVFRISDILDLFIEDGNITWRINLDEKIENLKSLESSNIDEFYKAYRHDFNDKVVSIDKDFPKNLYGKLFIFFVITLGYYLNTLKITEEDEYNVYDILNITFNGSNNVVY